MLLGFWHNLWQYIIYGNHGENDDPTWILDDFGATSWSLQPASWNSCSCIWTCLGEREPPVNSSLKHPGIGWVMMAILSADVCRTSHCDPFYGNHLKCTSWKYWNSPSALVQTCPNCPLWRPPWFWRAAHPKEQTGWRHLKTNTSGRTLPLDPLVSLFTMPAKCWDSSESAIQECQPLGCLATHFWVSLTPVACWLKQLSVNGCTLSDFLLRL